MRKLSALVLGLHLFAQPLVTDERHEPDYFCKYGDHRVILRRQNYTIERLAVANPRVTVSYYRASGEKKRPAVIISPILGSEYLHFWTEKDLAGSFAQRGFDAAIIERTALHEVFGKQDVIGAFAALTEELTSTYRKVIDIIEQDPLVRSDRICGFGSSFGGITTALMAGMDSRLRYNVIAVAGSVDRILEEGGADPFQRDIEKMARRYGSTDAFIEEFSRRVPLQPQEYAHNIDPKRTLLIIAKKDNIIPAAASEDLRSRMRHPQTEYWNMGHEAALVLPFYQEHIQQFLVDKIAADDLAFQESQSLLSKSSPK
jgi:dienelactone hydrolase